MDDRWRNIPGWEGLYQVSDLGAIRSLARIDALGRPRPGRTLSPERKPNGRLRVWLRYGSRIERRLVHRLVLEAFIGECPDGMEACHWNDDPSDNRLANLRWDTKSANSQDAVRNRTHSMARKIVCPQGHPYDEANTYVQPATGHRQCRTCTREQQRAAYWAKRRAA